MLVILIHHAYNYFFTVNVDAFHEEIKNRPLIYVINSTQEALYKDTVNTRLAVQELRKFKVLNCSHTLLNRIQCPGQDLAVCKTVSGAGY